MIAFLNYFVNSSVYIQYCAKVKGHLSFLYLLLPRSPTLF